MIAKWGIAGLKIDFIDRDDQFAVKWYEDVAKTAAENHLLIDFHGAFKPTGLERTWPNQITREGIQGNEYNKWSNRETPEHRATLPFTRVLAGPGDYTPGGFANEQPAQFRGPRRSPPEVQATRAGELAMSSSLKARSPSPAIRPPITRIRRAIIFWPWTSSKACPTVWDETDGLAGEVGQYVVEARRNGKNWYLAAITDSDARELWVPLKFLGAGNWKVTLWEDAPDANQNAGHLVRNEKTVRSTDTVNEAGASGGTVAIFSPGE